MQAFPFSEVTAVAEQAPGVYTGRIDPDWTIGGKPNGGYLLAMIGRAVTRAGAHPHVIAASAHYLRSPEPGPVRIEVDVLRAGRGASQVRARLARETQTFVEALFTVAALDPAAEPVWSHTVPSPPTVPLADSVRLPSVNAAGVRVPIMDRAEVRLDPGDYGFSIGEPNGSGVVSGWIVLPDGEDFDPVSLLYAVDASIPATMTISPTGWVPTLELTAYVRALPAPGPVRFRMWAQLIEGDRVDETCYVWDSRGRLVAQCTQLAGIRL